jgi:hypothetical protein
MRSPETSSDFHRTTRRYIREDNTTDVWIWPLLTAPSCGRVGKRVHHNAVHRLLALIALITLITKRKLVRNLSKTCGTAYWTLPTRKSSRASRESLTHRIFGKCVQRSKHVTDIRADMSSTSGIPSLCTKCYDLSVVLTGCYRNDYCNMHAKTCSTHCWSCQLLPSVTGKQQRMGCRVLCACNLKN